MYVTKFIVLILLISLEQCYSKKKHTSKKLLSARSHLHKATEKAAKASKKQDLNFDEKELNEGPIGKVVEGGLEGLGGDMHGYPAGMGAGAEPLGAFDQNEQPVTEGNGGQSLDDKSDSFGSEDNTKPFASENSDTPTSFEGRSPGEGDPGFPPNGLPAVKTGPGFGAQFGGLVSAQPFPGSNAPPARAVSMSNSLSNIDDKVNVQGDGEIEKMVLNNLKSHQQKESAPQVPSDTPSVPAETQEVNAEGMANEAQSEEQQNAENNMETAETETKSFAETPSMGLPVNDEMNEEAGKRRLKKQHIKPKTHFKKPFKKLQHKKRTINKV